MTETRILCPFRLTIEDTSLIAWTEAAELTDQTLEAWAITTLDTAAKVLRRLHGLEDVEGGDGAASC